MTCECQDKNKDEQVLGLEMSTDTESLKKSID